MSKRWVKKIAPPANCRLNPLMRLFAILLLCLNWAHAKAPNVLVIMADDMGYSDLGCYGGEIATPHLDGLARNGLRFTQFYNTARCWTTRAAMLTGYYAQQVRRDSSGAVRRGNRPEWARLLPVMLKPAGYRSYHSGKWHVDGMPMANGFDRSYYINNHGFFRLKFHFLDDQRQPATPISPDFYATDAIADHAITVLKEHQQEHASKPFFHFLAFTAPHFPLHALPKDIERYRARYRQGWEKIRTDRWERQKKLGLVHGPLPAVESKVGPPYHFPDAYKILGPGEVRYPDPWKQLTEEQQIFQADKMAVHAAMVDSMDRAIGRVLDQLRAMKAFDDTLILFMSDNGASAEVMVRGDGHDPKEPLGSAFTYLCLGAGWSTASNTPFRMHKTWVHEGGACTPLVAHWPKGITARGELRETQGHVIDVVPTVLELAGLPKAYPGPKAPAGPGRSLVPVFAKDAVLKRDTLWWAHEGNRAVRVKDWKLVAAKDQPWELFDLSKDRAEARNLATRFPAKVKELERVWQMQADQFARDAAGKPQK